MKITLSTAPNNILKCIAPQDRKGVLTTDELTAKQEWEYEHELQRLIGQYLNQRDIYFVQSRMDKKTTTKKGVADFLFCVRHFSSTNGYETKPFAIECKSATGKQTAEQKEAQSKMERNGWNYHVVRSLQELIELLPGRTV